MEQQLQYFGHGHEDRLQKVEENQIQLMANDAKMGAYLESVCENLERLNSSVNTMNANLTATIQSLQEKGNENTSRIAVIEGSEAKAEVKKEWWRKVAFWALTTGGGGLAAVIVERLLKHGH